MTALDLRLRQALHPWRVAPAWRIAFSGGLDSSVLLHLLADWARHEQLPPLSAVHVHHGLQSAADAWPEHCASVCEQLGIALEIVRVQVALGASLEQAARRARYKAFSERLKPGEVLLSAQHRDDQAETLLFRLLRGAGVRGLAAMPASRSLGGATWFGRCWTAPGASCRPMRSARAFAGSRIRAMPMSVSVAISYGDK